MKEEDFLGLQLAKERREKEQIQEDEEMQTSYLKEIPDEEIPDSVYKSPFDDDYEVPDDEPEDGEEENEDIRYNRIKTYFVILALLYAAFLGLGWYMTRYSGNKPQVLTFNMRTQQVFMEKMDEYIIALQNMHAESVDVFQQFDTKTLGTKEAILKMQKIEKALQDKKDELKDAKPPLEKEAFHARLGDVYSIALSEAGAIESFVQNPKKGKLEVLQQTNAKYQAVDRNIFEEYENFFRQ